MPGVAETEKGAGVLGVLEADGVGEKRLPRLPRQLTGGEVLADPIAADGRGDEDEQRDPSPDGGHRATHHRVLGQPPPATATIALTPSGRIRDTA